MRDFNVLLLTYVINFARVFIYNEVFTEYSLNILNTKLLLRWFKILHTNLFLKTNIVLDVNRKQFLNLPVHNVPLTEITLTIRKCLHSGYVT